MPKFSRGLPGSAHTKERELDIVTNQQATRVVQEIIRENQENGELEGILNRNRVAALNRLLYIAKARSDSEELTAKSLSRPGRPKRHT